MENKEIANLAGYILDADTKVYKKMEVKLANEILKKYA